MERSLSYDGGWQQWDVILTPQCFARYSQPTRDHLRMERSAAARTACVEGFREDSPLRLAGTSSRLALRRDTGRIQEMGRESLRES